MLWPYPLSLCFGLMLWGWVLGVCFGRMFWACLLGVCFGRIFWGYALGVCFKCMALERIALGASLWVHGFGRMFFGVWILPKKPEARTK